MYRKFFEGNVVKLPILTLNALLGPLLGLSLPQTHQFDTLPTAKIIIIIIFFFLGWVFCFVFFVFFFNFQMDL